MILLIIISYVLLTWGAVKLANKFGKKKRITKKRKK